MKASLDRSLLTVLVVALASLVACVPDAAGVRSTDGVPTACAQARLAARCCFPPGPAVGLPEPMPTPQSRPLTHAELRMRG